jgi:pantoate--beta-alanine ligase
VPTMGALHEGHLSLIKKSLNQNDLTIVSIFVNPTQFNNIDDLRKYPNTFKQDLRLLEKLKVDYVFNPSYKAMYPDLYNYKVTENNFSKILCGKFRPGHFDGVLTVVLKLLSIVKADRAYFGEKDYQQLKLVEGMTKAFFINTKVVPVPTVRNKDGLALSSRNLRLSNEDRIRASLFPKTLKSGSSIELMKKNLKQNGFKVEYIERISNRIFGAVYLGNVRLIDNVKI